jgi:hypothetical protein
MDGLFFDMIYKIDRIKNKRRKKKGIDVCVQILSCQFCKSCRIENHVVVSGHEVDLLGSATQQFFADDDPGGAELELQDGLDLIATSVVYKPFVFGECKSPSQVPGVDNEL